MAKNQGRNGKNGQQKEVIPPAPPVLETQTEEIPAEVVVEEVIVVETSTEQAAEEVVAEETQRTEETVTEEEIGTVEEELGLETQAEEVVAEEQTTEEVTVEEVKVAEESPSTQNVTGTGGTPEKVDIYVRTLAELKKMIPASFSIKDNKSGVTWFGDQKTRLIKLVETKKGLQVEFNVPVTKVEGLTILTEAEAKAKHMGTCRWIYSGTNVDLVKQLVKEAIAGFAPKKRSDSFEEKTKTTTPDPIVKEQVAKSGKMETRQLTDEEKEKLGMLVSDQDKEKAAVQSLQDQAANE